jgi:hypothetical protein
LVSETRRVGNSDNAGTPEFEVPAYHSWLVTPVRGQMGTEEEEEVRSNFNRSPGSFGIVHRLGGGDPAAPIRSRPVALVEDQYGPHFPPDRCGVDATVVDDVIMVWGGHEYWCCRRTRLPQSIQRYRQVDRRSMHGAGTGHGIIRIRALRCN